MLKGRLQTIVGICSVLGSRTGCSARKRLLRDVTQRANLHSGGTRVQYSPKGQCKPWTGFCLQLEEDSPSWDRLYFFRWHAPLAGDFDIVS